MILVLIKFISLQYIAAVKLETAHTHEQFVFLSFFKFWSSDPILNFGICFEYVYSMLSNTSLWLLAGSGGSLYIHNTQTLFYKENKIVSNDVVS